METIFLDQNKNTPPSPELPPPTGDRVPLSEIEKLGLQTDPTQETHYSNEPTHAETNEDAGVIDLAPLGKVVDSLKVSYFGLRYRISKTREDIARKKVEELSSPSKRQDEKLTKKRLAAHHKESKERLLATGYKHESYTSGLSSTEKAKQMDEIIRSNMTAAEKRVAVLEVQTKKTTDENAAQKGARKQASKTKKSYENTSRRISKRRARRILSAHNKAEKHSERAAKHLGKTVPTYIG